jgi:dipeptidyl-peptidase 4
MALLALPAATAAQGTVQDYERAERFRGLPDLVLNESVSPNWIEETDRFWYQRELVAGREFLVVDPARGTRDPAFDHARLAEALSRETGRAIRADSLPFGSFEYRNGEEALEFGLENAQRYRCDLVSYTCSRLTDPTPDPVAPGTSPDGRWVAFVRDYDLYLRSTETGWEVRLTDDGERDRPYATGLANPGVMAMQGTAEPSASPAVFWSPDSKRLATYRLDSRGAGRLAMVHHSPGPGERPLYYEYVYPLAPDSVLPVAEPIVFEVESWKRIPFQMAPITRQYYGGPSFSWFEDGTRLYTAEVDRGYTERRLFEMDARTGEVRTMVLEPGDPWVNSYGSVPFRFLDDGREVLWGSDRDGWMHYYLVDGATGEIRSQITSGEWVVRGIAHLDEASRTLYFTAGGREAGRDPYLEHLYRVNLDGSGLRLLTPENANHSVAFSPTGAYFVDTYSRADLPPVSVVRRASDGQVVVELEEADVSRLLATGWDFPEPFEALAEDGETDIYGIIWRPSNFDDSRSYPVVEQVYTGPHSFFVPKTFAAYRNHAQLIAELGFIVVQVDGRGTARRSRAFHDHSRMNLGPGGLPDHIAALRQLGERYPYLDLDRVGIYGHSAGGYDSTQAILQFPDFYKVAVSSAGNHDHRVDKHVWNVQWMGWPLGEHYDEQSNVNLAHRLEGKLLLAHGDLDDNVPVSATLQLVDALIQADKEFDLMILPNQRHGIGGHPYFQRMRMDYFVRHLLGVDPPPRGALAPNSGF